MNGVRDCSRTGWRGPVRGFFGCAAQGAPWGFHSFQAAAGRNRPRPKWQPKPSDRGPATGWAKRICQKLPWRSGCLRSRLSRQRRKWRDCRSCAPTFTAPSGVRATGSGMPRMVHSRLICASISKPRFICQGCKYGVTDSHSLALAGRAGLASTGDLCSVYLLPAKRPPP